MKDKNVMLEQYKTYVESAEKVSDRRQLANSYFLTLNAAILGLSGFLASSGIAWWNVVISIIGILASLSWLRIIRSYRILNKVKYEIIHKIEDKLPIQPYKNEEPMLKKEKYRMLSQIETLIPVAFMIAYLAVIIAAMIPYLPALIK